MNTNKVLFASLFIGAMTMGAVAQATSPIPPQILTCTFNEPFYTFEFNAYTGVVKRLERSQKDIVIATKAKLVALKAEPSGELGISVIPYKLVGDKGQTILTIRLTADGSDDMSDFIYPYSAVVKGLNGKDGSLSGGCTSFFKPLLKLAEDSQ